MPYPFPPCRGSASPWGAIQTVTPLGPDAVAVSTASHGGLPQTLKSRTQIEGSAARPILERLRHQPAIVGAQLAAEPKLVLDRGIPLQVGRIAGVEGRPNRR